MLCYQLYATPAPLTLNSEMAAMKACSELQNCIGFKKTTENEYVLLIHLTGYVVNETCKEYYLWDKSGGITYPKQPTELEATILFAIFPYAWNECPPGFDVDGSLCRGRSSSITGTHPSYMALRYDGTYCYVLQKQTVIDSWL
uniref:Uncharacterized protein n=1 Tax=Panagrolaimus sp. PS1159 TaxID=55785 RepID=A0AC35EWB4_9BILA